MIVDDRASKIIRSKLFKTSEMGFQVAARSYHQCFMTAAPIVHGRRPLIEEVAQLVVPPIVRHQYRWCHQSRPVRLIALPYDWSYHQVFSLPRPIYMGRLVGWKSLSTTTPKRKHIIMAGVPPRRLELMLTRLRMEQQQMMGAVAAVILLRQRNQQNERRRQYWVRPWIERRSLYGNYSKLMRELERESQGDFLSTTCAWNNACSTDCFSD